MTSLSHTFSNARAFNQPLSKWDTRKCRSLFAMFDGATQFNQQLRQWDLSSVTSAAMAPVHCFQSVNLILKGSFVSDEQEGIFLGASSFTEKFTCTSSSNGL